MRHEGLLLVTVGCLVLAGCSGALSGGGGGADEATLEDVSYPTGVSENGTNVSALAGTHSDTLENESFSLELDVTQNSSSVDRTIAMESAVDAERENVWVNLTADEQSMAVYTTAEKRYQRIATADGASYRATERTSDSMKIVPSSYTGASYLDQFGGETQANFTPTGVREVNGTTLVVLQADGSNVSAPDGMNITRYNATILVDEEGLVHRFETSVQTERNGTSTRLTVSMTISDVGDASVTEPAWLDEAREQTSN